jgi:hypothetical protein
MTMPYINDYKWDLLIVLLKPVVTWDPLLWGYTWFYGYTMPYHTQQKLPYSSSFRIALPCGWLQNPAPLFTVLYSYEMLQIVTSLCRIVHSIHIQVSPTTLITRGVKWCKWLDEEVKWSTIPLWGGIILPKSLGGAIWYIQQTQSGWQCHNTCYIFWIEYIPSGKLTVCYWKWPSRNSGFTH